jgi:DNA-binding transcriptional LysR family regulator
MPISLHRHPGPRRGPATFEGYAQAAIASGLLATLLDDWLPSFPGPFLYYPGRRQRPPSLTALVAFVKEWREHAGSKRSQRLSP